MATKTVPEFPMTTNSVLLYAASASTSSGGRNPWQAFDMDSSTMWITYSSPSTNWIKIDLGIARYIVGAYLKFGTNRSSNCNLSIQGSLDDNAWTTLWSATMSVSTTLIEISPSFTGDYWRYVRFYSTGSASGLRVSDFNLTCEHSLNYGEASLYYVSQHSGDDENDGLSPQTAWKTLTKANNTISLVEDSDITVYIAPGTYREALYIKGSYSDNEKIIFKGDPECIIFSECNPGAVRISGFDITEQAPIEGFFADDKFLIFCDGKIVFDSIEICSPGSGILGADIIKCKIWSGLYGAANFFTAKNCEVYSCGTGFYGISSSESKAYNCIAFTARSSFYLSSCYHCFGIGLTGFNSCVSYNCAAQYSATGFSSGSCYNCIASNCQNGFTSTAGSNRKSIGCSANTGDSAGSAFYFLPEIKTLVNNGLLNKGVPVINNPTDLLELDRATGDGNLDIGPIENCDYSLDYDNFNITAPSVRISREGQLSFSFRVSAGEPTIKQVSVKHLNTSEDLKPKVIVRGLGVEITKSASFEGNMWEPITISFVSPGDGVMEIVLCACDSNENAYSLFCNLL